MKTVKINNLTMAICTALVLFVSTPLVFAYPPDNAALLYYRASLIYDANDKMMDKLTGFVKGNIGIDKEIKDYVQKNKFAIKYFVDAGDAQHCDWGMDYSEGLALQMPNYAPLNALGKIVIAESRIAAADGDYALALHRWLSVHKSGAHIANDGILVSHLVGISLNALANKTLADILPGISHDVQTLNWLKRQVLNVLCALPPLKAAMNRDMQTCAQEIRKEKIDDILKMCLDDIPDQQAKIVRNGDDAFFEASREYFMNYIADVLAALDLPYPQSYEKLKWLEEKPCKEQKDNPHAIMTALLVPALKRVLCHDVRTRTHFNAVITAFGLYIARAKMGQLPDALPQDAPKDLFSGKPFLYEKTTDGFTLRCQGKDLDKDKIHQYEFKIKK